MYERAHRGPLLHIRGWLEYPESSVNLVKEILDSTIEKANELGVSDGFIKEANKAWTLPELQISEDQRYLMWTYLFIGAYLHVSSEDIFRSQVEELTKLFEWSGPIKIWMEGQIQIEDDAGKWAKTWQVSNGKMIEKVQ